MEQSPILEVRDLVKHFPITKGNFIKKQVGAVQAVNKASFKLYAGETLGLVGESGSGKSTIGKTIIRLLEPTSGEIIFEGKDLTNIKKRNLREIRPRIQMIFQDPYSSLNPRMKVRDILSEPLLEHNLCKKDQANEEVNNILELVGLNPSFGNRFPHEFSGGQRQRIGIARALMLKPSLIICDEPISALDVSVQAQIVNLLEDLQKKLNIAYLFIAHDLSMVRHISQRLMVMYLGTVVEFSKSENIYENPLHPYTKALLSAVPVPNPELERSRKRIILKGEIPSPINPPSGCRFRTRCPIASEECANSEPKLRKVSEDHAVACFKV